MKPVQCFVKSEGITFQGSTCPSIACQIVKVPYTGMINVKTSKTCIIKTSLLNNPKSMRECISFEFKKNSSCIYLFGIWLFWGVLHWYIEECFIFFRFVICGVCLHVFWDGSEKVSIDTAGSVLSREKGPQATGAAGPDGKYRQRVNTKDTIAWAHPWK